MNHSNFKMYGMYILDPIMLLFFVFCPLTLECQRCSCLVFHFCKIWTLVDSWAFGTYLVQSCCFFFPRHCTECTCYIAMMAFGSSLSWMYVFGGFSKEKNHWFEHSSSGVLSHAPQKKWSREWKRFGYQTIMFHLSLLERRSALRTLDNSKYWTIFFLTIDRGYFLNQYFANFQKLLICCPVFIQENSVVFMSITLLRRVQTYRKPTSFLRSPASFYKKERKDRLKWIYAGFLDYFVDSVLAVEYPFRVIPSTWTLFKSNHIWVNEEGGHCGCDFPGNMSTEELNLASLGIEFIFAHLFH